MQEYFIKDYIKKMKVEDIISFAKKKGFDIPYSDAMIIYTYAKTYQDDFLKGNNENIIKELKEKLSPNTFREAYRLYLEMKIKYLK